MKVAIGLPNAVAGTTGEQLVGFARRAEERGFSSLGTIDRIVYDNHDPFAALGAAAAVTDRIGLATTVCIAPPRASASVVAKQALTVQAISGGRLTLGMGLGGRDEDYEATGVPTKGKGKRFDDLLTAVQKVFAGAEFGFDGAIGPRAGAEPPPPIVIGGGTDAAFRRASRFDGWISGGGSAEMFLEAANEVRAAWADAGRNGEPYLAALTYFSLGPDAQRNAEQKLGRYYRNFGDELVTMMVEDAAKDCDAVAERAAAFERAGCDELFFFPADGDPQQADLLADAIGS